MKDAFLNLLANQPRLMDLSGSPMMLELLCSFESVQESSYSGILQDLVSRLRQRSSNRQQATQDGDRMSDNAFQELLRIAAVAQSGEKIMQEQLAASVAVWKEIRKSGFLIKEGKFYRFIHLTVQEFLSARYCAEEVNESSQRS